MFINFVASALLLVAFISIAGSAQLNSTQSVSQIGDEFQDTVDDLKKIATKKPTEEISVKLFRSGRTRKLDFPIRPPRLRNANSTAKANQKIRIKYASALQTRQTNLNSTSEAAHKTMRRIDGELSTANNTHGDIFELSSSDHSPTITFYIPKRNPTKRYGTKQFVIGSIKSGNNTSRQIPKLLLPKNLRPAMYSLHGFIPRPSMNKIASTEAPVLIKPVKFLSQKINNRKTANLETTSSKLRKFGGNKIEAKMVDKVDDIEASGSRRRSVIAKRKGLLSPAASQQKPTINRIINSKRKGTAGKDYPTFNSVPKTGFDCTELDSGSYADIETGCQVWHICQGSRKHSFLCPNGTIFNERNTICDWWYNVDCPKPVKLEDSESHSKDSERENYKKSKRKRLFNY